MLPANQSQLHQQPDAHSRRIAMCADLTNAVKPSWQQAFSQQDVGFQPIASRFVLGIPPEERQRTVLDRTVSAIEPPARNSDAASGDPFPTFRSHE
jgi:hypothetical protein